jgi:3-phenylpropionate/trans-cinnamate dioxygenase ferredoxin component
LPLNYNLQGFALVTLVLSDIGIIIITDQVKEVFMAYILVTPKSSIPAGSMKKFTAGGKDILIAHVEDKFYALNNRCTHMGGSLADGKLEGCAVKCPRHGATFDLETGKLTQEAHLLIVKVHPKDQVSYAVKLEEDNIWVDVP